MTDNIKLPPLPEGNVAHLIAAQAAEIEALRAKVERLSALLGQTEHSLADIANAQYLRAERLAEALRELVDLKDNVKHSFPNDYAVRKPLAWDKARALLRDQEEGK